MNRFLVAAVVMGAAGVARADAVSVGYSPVPLQREYVQTNLQTGDQVNQEATYGAATVQVLYTVEKKLRDKLNMTLTTGVGIPMGTVKFDNLKEWTNAPALVSKNATNEGDTEEMSAYTVPVLVGAKYIIPSGDNAISIGVSVGAMLIGTQATMTNVTWAGPVAAQTKNSTTVTYKSQVAPAFAGFLTLGYNIKMGEGESLGISVPLGLISQVRQDTETTDNNPPPAPPTVPVTTVDGWRAGGFAYGIQVGWNKSF
jgi:hypothetical protein